MIASAAHFYADSKLGSMEIDLTRWSKPKYSDILQTTYSDAFLEQKLMFSIVISNRPVSLFRGPGVWVNIKIPTYQYKKSYWEVQHEWQQHQLMRLPVINRQCVKNGITVFLH